MSQWRVIITDSESMTGVAPVCETMGPDHFVDGMTLADWVFDCCPHPHIECWNEYNAKDLALALTDTDAQACS